MTDDVGLFLSKSKLKIQIFKLGQRIIRRNILVLVNPLKIFVLSKCSIFGEETKVESRKVHHTRVQSLSLFHENSSFAESC